MKKYVICLILLVLMAGTAFAGPWVVCDPQVGITGYTYTLDGGAWYDISYQEAVKNGVTVALVLDCTPLANGSHSMIVKSFLIDSTWGRLESIPVPFEFTKLGSGSDLIEPSGFRIMNVP